MRGGTFSPLFVIAMVVVSAMSFAAFLVLSAYAPDLQDQSRAGAHPYSKSARGYATVIELLDRTGQTSVVTRSIEDLWDEGGEGLLVITLASEVRMSDLEDLPLTSYSRKLIVLPKWSGYPNRMKPSWDAITAPMSEEAVLQYLERVPVWYEMEMPSIERRADVDFVTDGITNWPVEDADGLQLFRGGDLVPILTVGDDTLLAQVPDRELYILSDPDVFATHGLKSLDHARLAVDLFNKINPYKGPILWDATLHGFKRSDNLIQLSVEPPFLGATLAALSIMCLIGWGAALRFGRSESRARVLALGKETLADNTAGLITMTHREASLMPGYVRLTRRLIARDLGLPKTYTDDQIDAVLDQINQTREAEDAWSDVLSASASVRDRDSLMTRSRHLFAWRKEITRDRDGT